MIRRYRKKPAVVEAVQWNGKNEGDILEFDGVSIGPRGPEIVTLAGTMLVSMGDYIVRGIQGELYPCKQDIFEELHEPMD